MPIYCLAGVTRDAIAATAIATLVDFSWICIRPAGLIWTVDVSPNSRIVATGAADNAIKLWNTQTGECVKTWEQPTAIKRVEFSEDGTKLLAVTEKRMGHLGTI